MWGSPCQLSPLILSICFLDLMAGQATVTACKELEALPTQRRSSRDVNSPAPVDCQLSQWSGWTDCFPCQEKKHRYRRLVQPAGFAGRRCAGDLWDEQACRAETTCTGPPSCGKDFQCKETGRCIKRHLVCNGETDCRDGSDEENCEEEDTESPCKDLFPIPGSEKAVQGYNILTQEERQFVYDPQYFGGQCEYVYNGEWRELKYDAACERLYYGDDEKYFRKPYNFHIYQFLAHADSGFAFEFYEDSKDLLDALKSDKSKTTGFTIGIGPARSDVLVNLGLTLSGGKGSLKNFTEYTAKGVGIKLNYEVPQHMSSHPILFHGYIKHINKKMLKSDDEGGGNIKTLIQTIDLRERPPDLAFIRAVTKVQTARFKMRRDNVVLDEDVLLSLQELPDTYNYGMYAKFINDYGTHFMTSGTMGGIFEYIVVINKQEMRRKAIRAEEISACIGLSLGLTASEQKLDLKASVLYSECKKKGFLETDAESNSAVVEDIIPRIKGGDTGSSGGLLNSWDGNMYRHWGRSLKYNPAVIDFELQPIHEILRRSNLGDAETKRHNLKRALDEYLSEFNACRCGPCQNNGEPILVGDACSCHCRPGYRGPACEQTERRGGVIDGRWSCWSGWSPCQAGTSRRSRQCTNPAPQNGGQPCTGRHLQSRAC